MRKDKARQLGTGGESWQERRDVSRASWVHEVMIVPVSGFGKGDPGEGIGRSRTGMGVANGNMADGKCVPASEWTGAGQARLREH